MLKFLSLYPLFVVYVRFIKVEGLRQYINLVRLTRERRRFKIYTKINRSQLIKLLKSIIFSTSGLTQIQVINISFLSDFWDS